MKRTPTKVRIIKTEPDAGEARDGDTEQLQESIQTLQNRDIDQKIEVGPEVSFSSVVRSR